MNLPILDVLADVDEKKLNLVLGPAQDVSKEHKADGLHALQKVFVCPCAAELVVGILGPGIDRPLVTTLDNVDKAGLGKLVLVLDQGVQGTVDLLRCLDQELVPLADGGVSGQGIVVRGQGVEGVEELNVAARVEVSGGTVSEDSGRGRGGEGGGMY